jgi:pilus assembly protein CpaB
MKPKTVMLLAVAVGSGLLAMLGVQQAMTGGGSKAEETVKVLVALKDIDVGEELLTDENVEFREMAMSAVPPDAVTKEEQYEKRSLTFALKQEDIIRTGKLSKPGVIGRSTQIPAGMRVYSIPVDDTQTVSGLLGPGDRVDVLVNYTSRDKNGRQVSKSMTLIEYVEVFATDDKTAREARESADSKAKTRVVALLLTPEQVNYVSLAKAKGRLELGWRNRGDDTMANVGAVNAEALDELKGLQDAGSNYWRNPEDSSLYANTGSSSGVPAVTDEEPAPPEPKVEEVLEENEQAPAAAVVVVPPPMRPKPTWNMHIHVGNEIQQREFELPEPPQPEASDASGQFWNLLKQAI